MLSVAQVVCLRKIGVRNKELERKRKEADVI